MNLKGTITLFLQVAETRATIQEAYLMSRFLTIMPETFGKAVKSWERGVWDHGYKGWELPAVCIHL